MRSAAGLLLLGAAGVLVTLSAFFGGGSGSGRLFWIGVGVVVCALAAVTASTAGLMPLPVPRRSGAIALALIGGSVAWTGLTIWWSVEGDRSWDYLNRGLVYASFSLLGLYVGALVPRPARVVAGGLCLLLGALIVWALAGKVIPALFPDGARIARLRNPIGYWNALALACDIALPLFLWVALRRRDLSALGVYVAVVALLLTYSRGGVIVGAVAVALWLVLGIARRESVTVLAVSLPVGLAVAGIGLALPGVAKDLQPHSVRVRDGALFGVALVLGAVACAWLARRDLRQVELRALALVAALLMVAGMGALAAKGSWLEGFRGADSPEVSQSSGRLVSASSNNRWVWWKEAWRIFERAPAGGKGAGAFEVARRPIRHNSLVTIEPHNLALQALAETGVIGLLLGGGAVLVSLGAATEAVRRLEGPERAAATALALALPLYVLHALGDIDWDYVAVSALVFLVLGVLIGTSATVRQPRARPAVGIAVAVCALAVLYSLTAPWLADRRVNDAYAALGRGDAAAAASKASEAHDLNPLSPQPYWAWALAEYAGGDTRGALLEYRRAVDLQPENSDTWYDLGAYEFKLAGYQAAYRDLNRAYTLDPWGPAGTKGGLLDQARAKVNAGAS